MDLVRLVGTVSIVFNVCVGQDRFGPTMSLAEQHQEMLARAIAGETVKCGSAFRLAWYRDHGAGSASMSELFAARPSMQASRLSPSGRFRVHFDTAGVNTPSMLTGGGATVPGSASEYVDSACVVLDFALGRIEGELKYGPLPIDTAGEDDAYDVFIESLSPGLFGETVPDGTIGGSGGNDRYFSYMVIDNDFADLRTPGLDGLRITAAHELFHAVQLSAYGVWDTKEFYFYELSSVWMETMIYPAVEDYLADAQDYFTLFAGASFATYSTGFRGYERSVFALYLAQRFGPDVIRRVWENVREERVLSAIDEALRSKGSSLRRGFREFAVWNHFTADRADTTRSYHAGRKFPRMSPGFVANWVTPTVGMSISAEALSHTTWMVRTGTDTLSILLANTDAASADLIPIPHAIAGARLSWGTPSGPAQQLATGGWLGVEVDNPELWSSEVFSSNGRGEVALATGKPWPSPWVLSDDVDLLVPVRLDEAGPVQVSFVSPSGTVVGAGERTLERQRGMNVIRVATTDVRGRLASGVYIVTLRKDSDIDQWKVAVVR